MKKTTVFIGDSLVYGYGVHKSDNWVSKLNLNSNLNIVNKGINGNTTTDMLFRFNDDVLSQNPNMAFIMGGTNDLLSNRSVSSIVDNIEIMIKDLLRINCTIFLGLPPAIISEDAYKLFYPTDTYLYCEKNLPILREQIIKLSNNYNLKYIDFYSLTLANIKNNIFLDGIHLNPEGQNLLYKEAFDIILK
ncbi:GDSL-type esterase/lipase family protein [Clostridium sp.]|uniref:GDSL-type esterase/lipase family protein n=1 Tax=Clostridium sp. TaxID=1506 RepID=UPI003F3D49F6